MMMGKDAYDDPTIAEWKIDPCIQELNSGLVRFCVTMNYDGTPEQFAESTSTYDMEGGLSVWKRTIAEAWKNKPVSDAISGTVWAKDKKHAVKIVNEFRVQQIALGKMSTRAK
jgi:hypothetical protein